ncbi:MAG: flagellar motor protein MotB [Oligoflexia bacterium]|nr:flagellar motor protein MotB [Oligoflexia bacterium]
MKKKHPEHVNLERWLVSYADFITLLFAFFVIMYAISQADMAKFKSVSKSIKAAFSGAGPGGTVPMDGNSGGDTANIFEVPEVAGGRVMNLPAGKTHTSADPDPDLQEMKELLEESVTVELGVSDVSDQLHMQFDSRGLVVRVAAKDFFEQGSAAVRKDLQPLLDRIGRIVAKSRRLIRIEGHTDVSEARPEGYASGWELSSARAAWVAKYWVSRFDIDPKRLGAAGYSHYRPLSETREAAEDQELEWKRARNRRIEIIILNNLYETP